MTQKFGIGVDLGGTKIATALVDGEGRVLARTSCLTEAQDGVQKVLERMYGTVDDVLTEAGIDVGQLAGIGIGSPGPIWAGGTCPSANCSARGSRCQFRWAMMPIWQV